MEAATAAMLAIPPADPGEVAAILASGDLASRATATPAPAGGGGMNVDVVNVGGWNVARDQALRESDQIPLSQVRPPRLTTPYLTLPCPDLPHPISPYLA